MHACIYGDFSLIVEFSWSKSLIIYPLYVIPQSLWADLSSALVEEVAFFKTAVVLGPQQSEEFCCLGGKSTAECLSKDRGEGKGEDKDMVEEVLMPRVVVTPSCIMMHPPNRVKSSRATRWLNREEVTVCSVAFREEHMQKVLSHLIVFSSSEHRILNNS